MDIYIFNVHTHIYIYIYIYLHIYIIYTHIYRYIYIYIKPPDSTHHNYHWMVKLKQFMTRGTSLCKSFWSIGRWTFCGMGAFSDRIEALDFLSHQTSIHFLAFVAKIIVWLEGLPNFDPHPMLNMGPYHRTTQICLFKWHVYSCIPIWPFQESIFWWCEPWEHLPWHNKTLTNSSWWFNPSFFSVLTPWFTPSFLMVHTILF